MMQTPELPVLKGQDLLSRIPPKPQAAGMKTSFVNLSCCPISTEKNNQLFLPDLVVDDDNSSRTRRHQDGVMPLPRINLKKRSRPSCLFFDLSEEEEEQEDNTTSEVSFLDTCPSLLVEAAAPLLESRHIHTTKKHCLVWPNRREDLSHKNRKTKHNIRPNKNTDHALCA